MSQLKRYNGVSWENIGGNIAPKTTTTSSDTDTYSCNYINSMIQPGNVVDAGNNWKKVDMGFARFYFLSFATSNQTFSGNGWGTLSTVALPTGITFDNTKMAFSGNTGTNDNAVDTCLYLENGATSINSNWRNKYGGNVTCSVAYNLLLIDFS